MRKIVKKNMAEWSMTNRILLLFLFKLCVNLIVVICQGKETIYFPQEDNYWRKFYAKNETKQLFKKWQETIDEFCGITTSELVIEGILECDKSHLDKKFVRICEADVYKKFNAMTKQKQKDVRCNQTSAEEFEKLFNECYISHNAYYARDYYDAYDFYHSLNDEGKRRVRQEMDKKRLKQLSWNLHCMTKIENKYNDLFYNHKLIKDRFCNETLTSGDEYLSKIFECTRLGYDSIIYLNEEKGRDCFSEAFGGVTNLEQKRQMICNDVTRESLHTKYAECYYGKDSEEANEERQDDNQVANRQPTTTATTMAPNDTETSSEDEIPEAEKPTILDKPPENKDAIVLDLHKDFDGFYLELDCILKTMHMKMVKVTIAKPNGHKR